MGFRNLVTYAMDCWKEAGVFNHVQSVANSVESFSPWLFQVVMGANEMDKEIWRHHNKKRWNNNDIPVCTSVQLALNF